MNRVNGWKLWAVVGAVAVAGMAALNAFVLAAEQGRGRLLDSSRDWNQRDRDDDDDRGPRETEVVERTVTLPADGTVRIKNFSGEIRVLPGSGRNVVVKATRRAPRETLDRIKLEVTSSGSTVTIDANRRDPGFERRNNVVETQMTVEVPASADLDIDAFSSDVRVDGLSGDQRIKTFSGTITVQGLKGEIDAETFSADIRVTLDSAAKGNVSFSSFSGSLDSDVPISTMSSGRRRSNNIEGTLQGGAGPRLRFHTFSGDVELRSR